MTIEELYGKVMADDGLKAELADEQLEGVAGGWSCMSDTCKWDL